MGVACDGQTSSLTSPHDVEPRLRGGTKLQRRCTGQDTNATHVQFSAGAHVNAPSPTIIDVDGSLSEH